MRLRFVSYYTKKLPRLHDIVIIIKNLYEQIVNINKFKAYFMLKSYYAL